jgi:hypothetical protein
VNFGTIDNSKTTNIDKSKHYHGNAAMSPQQQHEIVLELLVERNDNFNLDGMSNLDPEHLTRM